MRSIKTIPQFPLYMLLYIFVSHIQSLWTLLPSELNTHLPTASTGRWPAAHGPGVHNTTHNILKAKDIFELQITNNLPTTIMSPWSETVWNDGASADTSQRYRPVDDRFTDCSTTMLSVELCSCIRTWNWKEEWYYFDWFSLVAFERSIYFRIVDIGKMYEQMDGSWILCLIMYYILVYCDCESIFYILYW